MKISQGTIIRTVLLLLAIINNILALFGKSPLPIESAELENIVSAIITMVISLITWWKNNSFTEEAIKGDLLMNELRAMKKKKMDIEEN